MKHSEKAYRCAMVEGPSLTEEFGAEVQELVYRERLSVTLGGFAHFELLYSACKMNLFGYLQEKGPASLKKISRGLGIPEHSLRVMLLSCRFLGLVEQKGPLYSVTSRAEPYVREHPQSAWPILQGLHSIVYPPMHRLSESLRAGTNLGLRQIPGTGRTLYRRLSGQPRLEKTFHDWMAALGRSMGLGAPILEYLQPVLGKMKHLVDYGGGDGANAIQLCRHYPDLQVTVYDSPSVCELAKKRIQRAGLADRVFLKKGNFLKDPFIDQVDGVLFSHIFNIYSRQTNIELLRKSHASLMKGGSALIFNGISFDTEDGPAAAAVLSAYFLGVATGEGMVYPLKDYDEWFAATGFRRINKIYLPEITHGLVVAEK